MAAKPKSKRKTFGIGSCVDYKELHKFIDSIGPTDLISINTVVQKAYPSDNLAIIVWYWDHFQLKQEQTHVN